VRLEVTFGP